MKILVIGSGGREHALVWKINQSSRANKVYVAPGNAGTYKIAENVEIKADDLEGLLAFAKKKSIDLTVVGPEVPLALGIVDLFEENGLKIFGPNKASAKIEASKSFAKELMKKYNIPTAKYEVFSDFSEAKKYLETIKEFKGICINPNTKKPLNDDDIKDLQEQLKYKLLCDIEKIFIKMNTNLTDFYMKNKKNRVQK